MNQIETKNSAAMTLRDQRLDFWIQGLFLLFWLSCMTSQSLMDFSDGCLLILGLLILNRMDPTLKQGSWFKKYWPNTTGLGWLWLGWLLIIGAGLILGHAEPYRALRAFLEFRWMLIFQILCFTLTRLNWSEPFLKSIFYILAAVVGFSFVGFFLSEEPRAGGVMGQVMPFAQTFGPIFVFISGITIVGFFAKSQWRWWALTLSLATGLITALSLTRGVWLGMFVGLIIITFLSHRKIGLIVTALILAFFALTLVFSEAARERTLSTNSSTNQSDNERKNFWRANWEIVKDYPVLGIGYGENETHLREYFDQLDIPKTQFISHAHNQFLHFWAGMGTLGLLCFLIFLTQMLKFSYQAVQIIPKSAVIKSGVALGALGAQVCFIVDGLTESNFSIAKNRYVFLLISAVAIGLYHQTKSTFQKPRNN